MKRRKVRSKRIRGEEKETRLRLLNAAGEVFARRGFHHATVREICRAAKANVAAVNYHFRDKQGIYTAVLHYGQQLVVAKYPPTMGLGPCPTPRERLHAFIRSFLYRILGEGRPAWHGKLMVHEIADPTVALDALIENMIRPLSESLRSIVRDLLEDEADDDYVWRCASSIIGQCIFYNHARPVLERLYPEQRFTPEGIERLAAHVSAFSLGGLRSVARARKGGQP